ncbi:unnamed protein product [Meganyctiphanes norvegica]|uniref:Uncharacterized protein n=1 Tax=Meganyctiphanes norvegica TaxID=48144 RepID=A0AAV2Q9P0_MEGNR
MLPPESTCITPEESNKVHYWYSVKKIGHGLFIKLFKWLTTSLDNNIENEILNFYNEKQKQNGYNEKYNCYFKAFTSQQWYEWDFLESERRVLNNPESMPEDFTISLLGKLFKKVCPLLSKSGKLRDMIHEIVCLQNSFAKEKLCISDDELPLKLSDLETKYLEMLTEVSTLCESILISIPDEKTEIRHQFTNLQTWLQEPVVVEDYKDFEINIKQLRTKLTQEVQSKCYQKLKIDYKERCQDEPSPFFEVTGINHHKFTECHYFEQDNLQFPKEKEHLYVQKHIKKQINYTNLRIIKTLEMLKFQLANGELPPVILLHGDDHVGMSALCQLYALVWAQGKDEVAGLAHLDMVLYHDCGTQQISSLDDLISKLLHHIMVDIGIEVSHLREILVQLHILLILDRYEEANDSTLFSDSISIAGSMFRILTTSSSAIAVQLESYAIEKIKNVLDLLYQGMSIRNQERFVKRLLDVNITNEFEKNEIFLSIVTHLSTLNDVMGECLQQSPHILSDLTQLWIEGENVLEMTSTQIFTKINESLQRKLISNLLTSGIGMDVAEKCKIFYKYLCEIAYFAEFSDENELEESTVHLLREKCKQLKLSQNLVFSHYLIFKRFRREDQSIDTHYAFPHNCLKDSHASKHIAYLLQNAETSNFDSSYEWCEKLGETKYKLLLRNITGNLALLYPDMVTKYGKYILQLENQYNGNRVDNILCNVAESASNPECLRHMTEIASQLMSASCLEEKGDKVSKLMWTVGSNAALIPLARVLKMKKPQILLMENINYSAFKTFLPNVSQRRMDVNFNMDVGFRDNQIYDGYSVSFHDDYLMQLMKSDHIFKVKWFSGWLTESSISKLPQTLTRLKLNISTRNAPSLLKHVTQLQNLKFLEIHLFGSSEPKLNSFPIEFPHKSKLRQLTLSITGLCSEDLLWFTNLAKISSPNTGALHTIKLHNTTATGKSICKMIEELQKAKTTYERFEFKCKTNISSEDREMFGHLSKSSPHIRSIILYYFVEGSLVTKYSWTPKENMYEKTIILPQMSEIIEDSSLSKEGYEDVTNLSDDNCDEESSDDGVYYSSTTEMSDEEEDRLLSGEIGLEAFMHKRKYKSSPEEEQTRKKIKV